VEGLSLRRAGVHHPQPRRQDPARLADLRRDAGAGIKRDLTGLTG